MCEMTIMKKHARLYNRIREEYGESCNFSRRLRYTYL